MACGPGIVTGRYGTIGELYYQEGEYWPLNTALWVRNFFSNDPRFVYYLLSAFDFKKFSDKTGVPGVNRNDLHAVQVLRPPLPEQRRIAEILTTWDHAIETVEALIANARAQKAALARAFLTGQKRLRGFTGSWIDRSFADLFDIKIGGTPSRNNPAFWDDEKQTSNLWAAISDLKGKFLADTREYISDAGVMGSNVKFLPAGTLIMSFKLSIGRRAILQNSAYTNEAICALIPKNVGLLDPRFVYHALELMDFSQSVDQAVKGQTLNKAKLSELRIRIPELNEQASLTAMFETLDSEGLGLEGQLTALRQEKSALMQQLLTGKRRVKIAEDVAA